MIGFSASPSSAVANAGGAVSVGVTPVGVTRLAVLVDVAGGGLICGKLQFARTSVIIGTIVIMDRIILRFTACVEIIIPA
jgi:hypothetical protein